MEWLARLKLAWRILTGKAVMYRVEVSGEVKLVGSQDVHVVECAFRPGAIEFSEGETSSGWGGWLSVSSDGNREAL